MERLENIKLIVADLDGTLLDENKQIDSDMPSLLPAMREQGIAFTFGSGRNMHIMQDYVSQLQVDIPYITNNGANMFEGRRCIYECSMSSSDLLLALTLLKQRGIPFLAYSNFAVYPVGSHPGLTKFMERLKGKSDIIETKTIHEIIEHSIFKVVIIHDDENLMREVMGEINDNCKEAHCVRSEGDIYTLTHIDASKGNTLKKLIELMDVNSDQVLVFGDNYNDTSMFDVVKYSVAMGNSSKEIQDKATHVTKSNEEQGVSWFIKNYVLEKL